MPRLFLILLVGVALAGCHRKDEPDAYGNVEAIDVVVGTEVGGRLDRFDVKEGQHLSADAVVGAVETTQLQEQHREATALRGSTESRLTELARQLDALKVQQEIAHRAYERTQRLYAREAATSQQLDQAERDFRVLGEQIKALRAQQRSTSADLGSRDAKVAQVAERIGKGTIRNPIDGTVLATYVEAGEVVQAGQPLYRIADLRTVEVRAYISETQLASVHLGQPARVSVDSGRAARTAFDGNVTWMSSDAEFTPTQIQTREDRADLVYAVKITVANPDGVLKVGMPADVAFAPSKAGT
jgi:HlyD family secretion protein